MMRERNRSSFVIESLENRCLLSASVDANGLLTVEGTKKADTIVVSLNPNDNTMLDVTVNGTVEGTFLGADITGLVINGGNGNDSITVESIQGATQVEGDDPVVPVAETFSVAAKEFVRVQRVLDSLSALTVHVNGVLQSFGTDYTFTKGDKLVNFTTPKTGTVVVTYNRVVNNRGGLVDYVRSPALAPGTTFEDTIKGALREN